MDKYHTYSRYTDIYLFASKSIHICEEKILILATESDTVSHYVAWTFGCLSFNHTLCFQSSLQCYPPKRGTHIHA